MPPMTTSVRTSAAIALLLCFLTTFIGRRAVAAGDNAAPAKVIPGDQTRNDPFLGDWQGSWAKGHPRQLVAQVIPRGGGNYVVNFLPAFDQRCAPFATVQAKTDGKKLGFDQAGWSGSIVAERLTGQGIFRGKTTAFSLAKVVRLSPRLGAQPPQRAVVLFDGGNLERWESDGRGGVKEITWKKTKEYLRVWPPLDQHAFAAAIRTRQAWSNFQLHLEFRLPLIAEAIGQTRANGGIIIEEFEFLEVQILDSYGLPGYWDDCGGIYRKESPKFNMCAPPGQWQSYDIVYRGPNFDDAGKLVGRPRITVNLNGKQIHHDVELPYSDRAVMARRERPEAKTPGRIILQHHGDPIDFRNIWIVELPDESAQSGDAPNQKRKASS